MLIRTVLPNDTLKKITNTHALINVCVQAAEKWIDFSLIYGRQWIHAWYNSPILLPSLPTLTFIWLVYERRCRVVNEGSLASFSSFFLSFRFLILRLITLTLKSFENNETFWLALKQDYRMFKWLFLSSYCLGCLF